MGIDRDGIARQNGDGTYCVVRVAYYVMKTTIPDTHYGIRNT